MAEQIGFIGLGSMGAPMARNLLKAGYDLRAYNRDSKKADPLVKEGVKRGDHPADVVEPGGIVITMLANDTALESVTLGEYGILERLGPRGVHISMSTVSPAIAERLAEVHHQRACSYVASPVFGRPDAAATKKLWISVAGESAAKERVRPVLQALGQGIFDFGEEPGKANIVKLCGNFMISSAMESIAEALTLAEKNGLDRKSVIDLFGQTLFACPIYQNYGGAIAEKRYTPVGFQMKLALKDLNLILDAADQASMAMPSASLIHDRLQTGVAKGHGSDDWSALARLVSEDAGQE